MGWRERSEALATGCQPGERLGGRENTLLEKPAGTGLPDCSAHCAAPELLHLTHDADAPGPEVVAAAGRRAGTYSAHAVARRLAGDAGDDVHGEAPLRRRMERDRHVARRTGVRRRRAVRDAAAGAVRALRLVRLGLYERLGLGERDASADDSRLRHGRQWCAPVARRAVAPVLAHEAGLQDDEVPRVGDVHGRAARRGLGGSGVSVVWRRVIEPFSRCAPARRASPTRWGSGLPASWPSPAR